MSQEMQLSNNSPTAADYWTQGQSASSSAPAPKMSPLKKIHRLLRGRYPLAIVLAIASGFAGAAGGYILLQPKFESDAQILVNPVTPTNNGETIMPLFSLWIASQSAIIESTQVAEEALNSKEFSEAWSKAYSAPLPVATDFIAAIDAERVKASFVLKVAFTDKNKNVAQAGARATIAAYMKLHGNGNDYDRQRKLELLTQNLNDQTLQLDAKKKILASLSEKYGTIDLAMMHQTVLDNLTRLETDLSQAKILYDETVAAQANAPKGDKPADKEFIYQQIASVDQTMKNFLTARDQAEVDLDSWRKVYGSNHPYLRRYEERVADQKRTIDSYSHDYLIRSQGRLPLATDPESFAANLKVMQTRVDSLQRQVDAQRQKAVEVGTQRASIDAVHADATTLDAKINRTNTAIDTLVTEQKLAQNVKVVDPGSEAVPAGDKRKLAAGIGFVFGGLLPIGLMMLYGIIDHRVRYSDETDGADLAGVTLLGILPNLPDRLSDPQQAGVAAHCVHQIRTMLQINRSNDEPQVLAVTSAAAGDGKTSLTLALGLSYAACGARTLLIDCDLISAGLSHRLNVNAPEGVLESVANRALLEFVRTTDIADVAILPVGTTHAHHASTLSPVALRRLLSEAKKNFDIIIVDTGPILGSIEASLVCAAADRTILTIARGQQRMLVERLIGHLQAIGADVAGVVFNRAQAADFERSLSGLALRTRSSSGATATTTASASAVSGSFKRAG